jgi:hypothetical protein
VLGQSHEGIPVMTDLLPLISAMDSSWLIGEVFMPDTKVICHKLMQLDRISFHVTWFLLNGVKV